MVAKGTNPVNRNMLKNHYFLAETECGFPNTTDCGSWIVGVLGFTGTGFCLHCSPQGGQQLAYPFELPEN